MIDPELKKWIIIVVTTVWSLNFFAGLIPQWGYKPDQAINAIFMAIVGGLFAISARKPPDDKPPQHKKQVDKPHDEDEVEP